MKERKSETSLVDSFFFHYSEVNESSRGFKGPLIYFFFADILITNVIKSRLITVSTMFGGLSVTLERWIVVIQHHPASDHNNKTTLFRKWPLERTSKTLNATMELQKKFELVGPTTKTFSLQVQQPNVINKVITTGLWGLGQNSKWKFIAVTIPNNEGFHS